MSTDDQTMTEEEWKGEKRSAAEEAEAQAVTREIEGYDDDAVLADNLAKPVTPKEG